MRPVPVAGRRAAPPNADRAQSRRSPKPSPKPSPRPTKPKADQSRPPQPPHTAKPKADRAQSRRLFLFCFLSLYFIPKPRPKAPPMEGPLGHQKALNDPERVIHGYTLSIFIHRLGHKNDNITQTPHNHLVPLHFFIVISPLFHDPTMTHP